MGEEVEWKNSYGKIIGLWLRWNTSASTSQFSTVQRFKSYDMMLEYHFSLAIIIVESSESWIIKKGREAAWLMLGTAQVSLWGFFFFRSTNMGCSHQVLITHIKWLLSFFLSHSVSMDSKIGSDGLLLFHELYPECDDQSALISREFYSVKSKQDLLSSENS